MPTINPMPAENDSAATDFTNSGFGDDEVSENNAVVPDPDMTEAVLAALGKQVLEDFNLARSHRLEVETRWISDLRQYKGIYEPDVTIKPGRSRIFLRLTRAKVKSLNARLGDMLFPAGDKNWNISSTPVPKVDPQSYQSEIQAIQARNPGQQLDKDALKAAINEVAKERCENMSKEIDDQLEEGDYEACCRRVIASATMFGTGVLKGPIGMESRDERWEKTAGGWTLGEVTSKRPTFMWVPIWDYYPDPATSEQKSCRFEIQHHSLLKSELDLLKQDEAFMADRIELAMERYPGGNRTMLFQWETDLRMLNKAEQNKPPPIGQFSVIERWGEVSGKELKACGCQDVDDDKFYEGQVWVIDDIVIRAQINPYDSNTRPFKLFYIDKDESSIFAEGLPTIMRDMQVGTNASIRALTDNAAASAIPMFEVNRSLMPSEADQTSIVAGRVWTREGKGADSQYPAIRAVEIPCRTDIFQGMVGMFQELMDEVTTLPRYSYGTGDQSGISKTVGGLSMLIGQSNIALKELVKNWDDGITTPFIRDMYHWNMQFGEDPEIKGDFQVIARGSSSLVAKEIRANALAAFTSDLLTGAPNLAKLRELYAERARNLDLDPDMFLNTQDEMDAASGEKLAKEALTALAQKLGIAPEALLQNFGQFLQSLGQPQQPQPQLPPPAPQPEVIQ